MDGGISGINKSPLEIQSLDVQDTVSTQTNDVDLQLTESLGTVPRDPLTVRTNSEQTVPTRSLSSLQGANRGGVRIDPQRLQIAQDRARAGLPKQIGITVPPSSRAVTLDSNMMAKEIQSLPRNQRQQAMSNAQKTLQQRVNNGFKVYQQIQNGTATTPASLTDVRDFMTFLTAKASQKTSSFSQGAFNLPDPGNKIRNFLDSSTEVYQRTSTHIEGFSSETGCGHRGIDLKLPHGHGTLLYGGMKNGVMGTQGDRIFIKMESHGCRISTLSQDKVDTEGPQSRPKRFFSDLLSSIKHGFGGLKTLLGLQKTDGTRKERVDKGVEREFKALVQMAEDSGVEGLVDLLNANDPAGKRTGRGIRTMMENIDTVLQRAKGESLPDEGGFVDIELDEENILDLPEELQTKLEGFQERIRNSYDHVEHRIGNEMVLSTDELNGTNSKEGLRDGHARALVTQLMKIEDGDSVTTEDVKGLITTMYAYSSNIDAVGGDGIKTQRETSLAKAINGLSTEQKTHLTAILTSEKIVSLANEFLGRSMGLRLDMPGHNLSHQQGLNVRGLMAESGKILFAMTKEVGGEIRQDGEYPEGPVGELTDTIFNLTESLSEVKIQENIHNYLSGVGIKERSGLEIQDFAGTGNMVLGTSAKALFPDGLPRVNSEEVNAKAKEDIETILTTQGPLKEGTLAGRLGISDEFMRDFHRGGIEVNGEKFGGGGTNISQEQKDKNLQALVDAVGGIEKTVTLSRLMFQGTDSVCETTHFLHTDETGGALSRGMIDVQQQTGGNPPIPVGGTRSVTINEDGSAIISLKSNKGSLDQVSYNTEVGIRLSRLDEDIQVTSVNLAMMFISND